MTNDQPHILVANAMIFDGTSEQLAPGMNVLVEGNTIAKIAKSIPTPAGATVVDAKGKVLMPGLIDAHHHPMMAAMPLAELMSSPDGWINLAAAKNAELLLLQGFTTVREASGNSFSLKRAIDHGLYPGPRIYPTGPMISQTSGHGDFRPSTGVPAEPAEQLTYISRNGYASVADGVPEVMKRTREALRMGASQVKLAAGGGSLPATTRSTSRNTPCTSSRRRWTWRKPGTPTSWFTCTPRRPSRQRSRPG